MIVVIRRNGESELEARGTMVNEHNINREQNMLAVLQAERRISMRCSIDSASLMCRIR